MNKLQRRIIEISYKHEKPHVGSNLTAVNILDKIYKTKKKSEPVVLSNGHVCLALCVVLEKYEGKNAEKLCLKYGTHPRRNLKDGIWCTTGSLGNGLPIAVGMALANRKRKVYCTLGDGEATEGSIWEALRIAGELNLTNLKVIVDANGHGAFHLTDADLIEKRLNMFFPCEVIRASCDEFPSYLQGILGRYTILNEQQYKELNEKY